MHYMGVFFYYHIFVYYNAAVLCDSSDIIPAQVKQHNMLSTFFWIG